MTAPELKLPRPHGNRILVFVPPTSGMVETKSGLHVVQSASEAPLIGHVLAVGPDVSRARQEWRDVGSGQVMDTIILPSIQPHNHVMFSKYAGKTATIGGREYHIITEEDVDLVWPETFDLPEELQAPAGEAMIPANDGPCVCHPLDENGRCSSSSCINASEPSGLVDDARSTELVTR